ncbi:MAG TPA: hypothetical protein PLZ51_23415, partial [Aggregatilineales bacterium]|nr:hypothetical protein [Aggregatilineales bacterium]
SITFTGELEVGRADTTTENLYNNIISFKPDVTIDPPISEELLDYVINNQEELNNLPLDEEIVLDDLLIGDDVVL